jgi:allantoin racemase
MKILVLNPNTSNAVTEKVAKTVRRIQRPDVQVTVTQIAHGPETLESYYDESMAAPYIFEAVRQAQTEGYDAIVLAAFCDPAIEAVREISTIPIYTLEETSFSVALLLGNKFGILTEKKHKESVKRQHVRKYGLESRFASVRALNMSVAEITSDPEKVKQVGKEIMRRMIHEDGAEVIVLGCASMTGYSDELERDLGVPILDPIIVTYKVAEALAEAGVRHSKVGLYAVPAPKKMN